MNEIIPKAGGSLQTVAEVSGACRGCRRGLKRNCQLPDATPYLRVRSTNSERDLQNPHSGAGCDLVVLHGAEVRESKVSA